MHYSSKQRVLLVLTAVAVAASKAHAAELLVNGDFETGDFTGWSTYDQVGSDGTVYNQTGTTSPVNGFATVGAAGGTHYALTDQGGPGSHVLLQSFTVAPGASTQLSFDMFVNDQSGSGGINAGNLDFVSNANQHARVDILSAGANPFDTGGGVLANYYTGVDAGANPHSYTSYNFDISSVVAAGGTFQIRFAEVDNQFFMNLGVDNVSIISQGGAISTPDGGSSLLFLGIGLASLVRFRCSR